MRRLLLLVLPLALVIASNGGAPAAWHMNATAIEACSCPMFCQCYFNTKPAAHHDSSGEAKHYCKANLAYKINHGTYGATKLDGAKFWIVGDLGGDWSQGEMDWATVYFDKATSKEQREALGEILPHVFPAKWKSFDTAEASIDTWRIGKNTAVATMDGGKTAEVRLKAATQTNVAGPIVMKNLKYWGAPRNDGFIMMPNEVEAYRVGEKAFEFKGTNGFLITIDIDSKDTQKKPSSAAMGSY